MTSTFSAERTGKVLIEPFPGLWFALIHLFLLDIKVHNWGSAPSLPEHHVSLNLDTGAGTALQHKGALQSDYLWRAASNKKSPARIQLLLGRMEAVDLVSWAERVAFGAVQNLGLGKAVFIQHHLLLLFLCEPLQTVFCPRFSLIPHPGQHEQHFWVHRISRGEGPAHSLDQADGCSQNRQHRAQQVDLQQAPARFLSQHLFGKWDQLLHAVHVFSCSERSKWRVSRTSLWIFKVGCSRTYCERIWCWFLFSVRSSDPIWGHNSPVTEAELLYSPALPSHTPTLHIYQTLRPLSQNLWPTSWQALCGLILHQDPAALTRLFPESSLNVGSCQKKRVPIDFLPHMNSKRAAVWKWNCQMKKKLES